MWRTFVLPEGQNIFMLFRAQVAVRDGRRKVGDMLKQMPGWGRKMALTSLGVLSRSWLAPLFLPWTKPPCSTWRPSATDSLSAPPWPQTSASQTTRIPSYFYLPTPLATVIAMQMRPKIRIRIKTKIRNLVPNHMQHHTKPQDSPTVGGQVTLTLSTPQTPKSPTLPKPTELRRISTLVSQGALRGTPWSPFR